MDTGGDRKGMLRWLPAVLLALAGAGAMAEPTRDLQSDTWVATDGLGRTLPTHAECGPPRAGKFVGIFYFAWLYQHSHDLYDITKILAADPDRPAWGPPGAFHFWGEPHFGYYRSDDEWVIRRHAQMLADAGVDVIVFDVTNGFTYDGVREAVCRVFSAIRAEGRTTPQLAFLCNAGAGQVAQHLHETFYQPERYPELWFRWQDKPLLLAPPDDLAPALREFFTVRRSWAWSNPNGWFGDGHDRWPWLDHYPQAYGWHEPGRPEQMPVCVAQHPVSNIGRSFHDGRQPPPDAEATDHGLCFAEQWRRALEVDPDFIFITGWNEWVAQRFIREPGGGPAQLAGRPLQPGDSYFVDQYNQEFSRDIEPMRGGHADHYYYQMVAGIRRFKGVRPSPAPTAPVTIPLNGDFAPWDAVGPVYLDDLGDTAHRDHPGWDGAGTYTNTSGRNDIERCQVARDVTRLYFHARTREPLTPPDGRHWMMLLLDVDGDPRNGWEGFDYVVNRVVAGPATGLLERCLGGWRLEPVAEVPFVAVGRDLHFAIPRAALGLDAAPIRLSFQWADNIPDPPSIVDFIDQGDVAPNGRFRYRFEER